MERCKWGAGINSKGYQLWNTINNHLFQKFCDFLLENECNNLLSQSLIISIQVLLDTIKLLINVSGFNNFIATGINTLIYV